MKEILEQTKPVEGEARPETVEKLEILDRHSENWALANKGEFLGPDFNKYLEELKDQGVLKFSPSPGRLKWAKRAEGRIEKARVIEPIGDDKEGGYYYGSKQNIHAGVHGNIFGSLPELREKTLRNEQPMKKHSKERPKKDTKLLKYFEDLMREPLYVLDELEKKVKKEDESVHSPFALLKRYAWQLHHAVKENRYSDIKAIMSDLKDVGITESIYGKDEFNNVLSGAEGEKLIEKTSEEEFEDKKEATEFAKKAKQEEVRYLHSEKDPKKGWLVYVDVYNFKGNENSGAHQFILNDLKKCAKIVEDLEWIKSSIHKCKSWREQEIKMTEAQRTRERKRTDELIKSFKAKEKEAEQKPRKKTRKKKLKTQRLDQEFRPVGRRGLSFEEQLQITKEMMQTKNVTPDEAKKIREIMETTGTGWLGAWEEVEKQKKKKEEKGKKTPAKKKTSTTAKTKAKKTTVKKTAKK